MPHTPVLITGCQRSGTTLLRLVIDSHPEICSIDEDKFECWYMNTYINAPWLPEYVAFKLPRYAPDIPFIILDFIGVDWNDDVPGHHEMHEGKSIGETSNKRPIDNSSVGQGAENFSQEDIDIVENVCRKAAEKWGYM